MKEESQKIAWDRERQISYHLYVESKKKKNDTNELVYKTEDSNTEKKHGYQREGKKG